MYEDLVRSALEKYKFMRKLASKSLGHAERSEKKDDCESAWNSYFEAGFGLLGMYRAHESLGWANYLIAIENAGNNKDREAEILRKLEKTRSDLELAPLPKIKECFEKAWELSGRKHIPALMSLAKVFDLMGLSHKSIESYTEAANLLLESGGFGWAGRLLADAGIISNRIGDFERARELLEKSIDALEKTKEYEEEHEAFIFERFSDACILASETLREKGETEKADEYLRMAADGYAKAGKCEFIIESIMMNNFERWAFLSFASYINVKLKDFSSAAECSANAYACWPFKELMPWDLVHAILFSKLAGSWNARKIQILESKATKIISEAKAKMISEHKIQVSAEFSIASYSILEALLDLSNGDPMNTRKRIDEVLKDSVDLGIADVNLEMAGIIDMLLNRDPVSASRSLMLLEKRMGAIKAGENGFFEAVKKYRHAAEIAFLSEIAEPRPAETGLIELIRERLGIAHIIDAVITGKPLREQEPFENLGEDARYILDLMIHKFKEDRQVRHQPLVDAGWFSVSGLEIYARGKENGGKWSRGTFYKKFQKTIGILEKEHLVQIRQSEGKRGRKPTCGMKGDFRLNYGNMRLAEYDAFFRNPLY